MAALQPQESFVERIIRDAIERGEFEGLAGQGRPIPGVGEIDGEGWWIRRWIQRSRAEGATGSPPTPNAPPPSPPRP